MPPTDVSRRRVSPRLIPAAVSAAALLSFWACSSSSTDPQAEKPCPGEPGTICTLVGNGDHGFNGDGKSLLASALYWPEDVTQTSDGTIYVVDWNNHRIRVITGSNTLRTVVGTEAFGDGIEWGFEHLYSELDGTGAPGEHVNLNHPTQMLELPNGKIALVAWHGHKIRTFDPATGRVQIMCGAAAGFSGDGGPAAQAKLNQPQKIALDASGRLFILDQRNQRVRMIDVDGTITTVVGSGKKTTNGFPLGDGGPPLQATMAQPDGGNPPPGGGICLDEQGRIYFTDVENHRVRRVDLGLNLIETVVGTGVGGFNGDGSGTEVLIDNPRDIELGPDGRIYFADEYNNRIRAYDPVTGTVETVAGSGPAGFGTGSFAGDGGPPTDARLNRPAGVAFGRSGELYVSDTFNGRVRVVRF